MICSTKSQSVIQRGCRKAMTRATEAKAYLGSFQFLISACHGAQLDILPMASAIAPHSLPINSPFVLSHFEGDSNPGPAIPWKAHRETRQDVRPK